MSDPTEDIAVAIKDFISAPERAYPLAFEASVPDNPWADMFAEDERLRVLVVPTGAKITKENRSKVLIVSDVQLLFCKRMVDPGDRKKLSELTTAVEKSLRFVTQGRWIWQGTEIITKFDSELIRKMQFVSAIQASYAGIE